MKTIFSSSVKVMAMAAMMVMGATSASAKDIDTTPFDKVQVDVEARVRIVDGDKYSVSVRSTDKALAEDIKVNVADGTLAISSDNANLPEGESMVITITCPTDLDILTSYSYEAHDVETDNTLAIDDEPVQPDFRHMPFHFVPGAHGRMPHHMPMMMHRPWGRA